MTELKYIEEEEGLKLLLNLLETQSAKGVNFIRSPKWASVHCVGTAKKGRDLALRAGLDGDLQYAVGIFHDAGKLFEPDPFHEIVGAWYALSRGEEFGLVTGGNDSERRTALKQIASCIIADGPVYEEWTNNLYAGTPNRFSEGHDGEFGIVRVENRLEELKTALSDGNSLSLERLLLPIKMEQKIALVADMADVDDEKGVVGGMKARFNDILQRYEDPNHADYSPIGAKSARMVMSRYYQVLEEVADAARLRVFD
jgi:hypothetical protein